MYGKKYLPIGTVCTIKGENKQVMITGFYSVKYNGNLKINDYVGCYYPEGMLIPEGVVSFNHSDIEKVDFIGYKNEENDKTDVAQTVSNTGIFSKIVFDDNGMIVEANGIKYAA